MCRRLSWLSVSRSHRGAVRYVLKADAERQTDAAIPVSAVSVKVTAAELAALDEVLAKAGVESRAEGLRRADPGGGWGVRSGRANGSRDGALQGLAARGRQWGRTDRQADDAGQPDGAGGSGGARVPSSPNCASRRCAGWRGSSWIALTRSTYCYRASSRCDAARGHGRAAGVCPCG